MANRPRRILATGIPGCGRKEHLNGWEEYCDERGKKVKIFHVGKQMFEYFRDCRLGFDLNPVNVLNADWDFLDLLRAGVFKEILKEVQKGATSKYDALVLCVHAFFDWNDVYIGAIDRFLGEFEPDIYITFIDDYNKINAKLSQREQWQNQGLTPAKTLKWQGLEGETTSRLADMAGKQFFAVPTAQSPSLFYKLVFHPEIETVYSAMPISHFTDPEDREQIDKFIAELEKYFAVFIPTSVEMISAVGVKSGVNDNEDRIIHRHIVYRDLRWFVQRVNKVVVFWPKRLPPEEVKGNKALMKLWPNAISSPGVDHETHAAFTRTKDVWTVYLGESASPFVTCFQTGFFPSKKEFFEFLAKKYPGRTEMKW